MTTATTSSMADRLSDLEGAMEDGKVKLSAEVQKYLEEHVFTLEEKVFNEKDLLESDLEFIGKIKMWVLMPEELREIFDSVEKMEGETKNAQEREITLAQWLDVLYLAEMKGKNREWIDRKFEFENGEIKRESKLALVDVNIKRLPERLNVKRLYLLKCTSLERLPEELKVEYNLHLELCTALKGLPEGLKIKDSLFLSGCKSLKNLPKGLQVGGNLKLWECTGLTSLPEGLRVGNILDLSKNLHEQVKKDAERMQKEGKIGKIKYI